ncbi:class I SAM-dependent methyltransferase [Sphingobium chlorophenolicum]|uniref:Methyltransferase n=1 Tax=Sphingobium chlorophenolicum TaxID=46429 RepID=A0A081RGP3_SPHCR|nr:class I SAM-dependent methyltransferase [Sphingobium chlorophenolicum]KEQ54366.1 hypothetical protein BV95_01431 [Sphingobium chlorophenolicum]
MTAIFETVMQKLYRHNVWEDFSPQVTEENVQGWNGTHPSLSRLTSSPGSKIIVDVGVWKGQSTITMANALKANGIDGVVIAVDTFLGSPEHWFPERKLFSRKNGLPDLYNIFMSNVYRAGLTDYIVPMAQTSSTAAKIIRTAGINPTLIHVDAAHEYREAIQDIEDYWEILQTGGYLIGDDYHVSWPGVVKAAGEFSAKVEKPLAIEAPKFIIQKT